MVDASEVLHSQMQNFIYRHPDRLLPYLNTLMEGCIVISAEKEVPLRIEGQTIGGVDVLLTVEYDDHRVMVPVEVKHSHLNGAMKQLRRYAPHIDGCSPYGLAVAGSPNRFEVGGVDFRREHSEYIKL